uniref:Aminotransferase-like plant mobile domain-containing protein n=1 Tax=Fagus sylvatica TaxID=28930 RepID=A0A2N9EL25_FAGSY
MRSLTYLSATNAGWLPVLASDRLQFTAYSAHRVRRQFNFDQEVLAVMGIAAGEIPIINPFLKARAFAYWSGITPRVIVPSGDRVGVYITGMVNCWRELMAAMVEFRNNGRGDISHLLQSYISPLPHPRLFVAMNTMTTYANHQSLGYAVWYQGGVTMDDIWQSPSSFMRNNPADSRKEKPPAGTLPAQALKKKKTTAARASRGVIILRTAAQDPLPVEKSAAQGVSAPVSKKPIRKTRAGKRTFVPPAFPNVPTSIAARVAARKSTRGIVYFERRSKQRVDTLNRVPIVIPELLAEGVENEDIEVDAAETVFEAETVAVEVNSVDESTASGASSGGEGMVAGTSTEEDEVSMDELEAAEASFDNTPVASASNPRFVERAVDEHTTAGVVTSAARAVETTPITIISSGLFQLLLRVPTPPSPLHESRVWWYWYCSYTRSHIAVVVSATITIQDSEAVPAAAEEVPGSMTQVAHAEVAASEDPVQADATLGSDVLAREGVFAQDPADDVSMEDMADTHDSYDELDGHGLMPICCPPSGEPGLMPSCCSPSGPLAGSSNEAIAEEERGHQTAAVESAIRGQPRVIVCCQEARAAALRDALSIIAPEPMGFGFLLEGVSAESHAESALYGLLA